MFPNIFFICNVDRYTDIPDISHQSDQLCRTIKQPKNCSATANDNAFLVIYTWSIIWGGYSKFVLITNKKLKNIFIIQFHLIGISNYFFLTHNLYLIGEVSLKCFLLIRGNISTHNFFQRIKLLVCFIFCSIMIIERTL